jgi:histone-lysine N-methyltransferase SETD2
MDEIGEETTPLTECPIDTMSDAGANNDSVENMDENGEETTTLTDGPIDPMSDAGANNGSVENMDEIGIIFSIDGKNKKVRLKELGSYVWFNKKCFHKGYKKGETTTFLSAQIFSRPGAGSKRLAQSNVAEFKEGLLNEVNISRLKNISEGIQKGWKEVYMLKKYNAPKEFQLRKIKQHKTRKIVHDNFEDPGLDKVKELITIFETIYNDTIKVVEVWFLKKKASNDGFEKFHYDFGSSKGGFNDVSSTIVVNLGVFHEENKEEEEELEEESEDEESNDESVEECVLSNSPDQPKRMMPADRIQILNQELTPDEEQKINSASYKLQNIKDGECLTSGDICKYFDYLGGQDKQLCKNCPDRKPSLFHSTDFITFDSDGTCKYLKNKRTSKIDISRKRNIFIPIHKGHHFTCVVIFLDKKQIHYYDSLLAADRTRTGCAHKQEQQEKILCVVMQYLQDELFKNNKNNLFDKKDWSLQTMCNVPQQDNTTDCGIFVCLYCDFILHDCALDFKQDDIKYGEWRKKIVLSILSINDNVDDISDPVECIEGPPLMWKRKMAKYVEMTEFNLSKICDENWACHYECDDTCNGRDECTNKRIQREQWKDVEERDSGDPKKGFGLFLKEGCKENDFIIEYTGEVTKKHVGNYIMRVNPPPYARKTTKVYIDGSVNGGLAKYINHSCNPNCELVQWYVGGLPRLCFFARKEITSGTELTFDYNWTREKGKKRTECTCGEENCLGYIEK